MYRYDEFDRDFLRDRNREFRAQVARRLAGELSEDEFKPLRLMNGLYLQLHAYMLRVAIPYGVLSAPPAAPARHDRAPLGQGASDTGRRARTSSSTGSSWSTCPTFSKPWPKSTCTLSRPAATAFATSRPTPSRAPPPTRSRTHVSGRKFLRQWSTNHPEFTFLPRKFKIAITGRAEDRAAIAFHDIGIRIVGGPKCDDRLPDLCRRRTGPHALRRPGDEGVPAAGAVAFVSGSHAARL